MTKRVVEIKPPIIGAVKPSARAILTPKEPLTYQNRQQFKTEFKEAISQDKIEIILDCRAVPFIDSAGLELLVELDETLTQRGGILKLVGVCPLCIDILVATRLINVFHVYSDVYEAIRNGA